MFFKPVRIPAARRVNDGYARAVVAKIKEAPGAVGGGGALRRGLR